MSAYSRNYFKDGYVEKGDTVYVLSQKIAGYENGAAVCSGYTIEPYIVTAVGRKYLSAKAADSPARRIEKFGPIASVRPAYGLFLEETGTPLGDSAWRNRLYPTRRRAELDKKLCEVLDTDKTASGGGGKFNADTK